MDRDIEALLRFVAARTSMPHEWGRRANDCVSFVLGAVEAETGEDRLPDHRWSTERGGMRVIRRLGGLERAFDARFRRIEPAEAMRGDIGAVADPVLGVHPMLVEGATLTGPGPRGLRRLPRSRMIAAWSAVGAAKA